jgi:hypothetical protein
VPGETIREGLNVGAPAQVTAQSTGRRHAVDQAESAALQGCS